MKVHQKDVMFLYCLQSVKRACPKIHARQFVEIVCMWGNRRGEGEKATNRLSTNSHDSKPA